MDPKQIDFVNNLEERINRIENILREPFPGCLPDIEEVPQSLSYPQSCEEKNGDKKTTSSARERAR